MAERQLTELTHLDAGLDSAEDPYRLKDLLLKEPEELAEEVRRVIRFTSISMIQAGRLFMAIKSKLKFGQWEPFVIKQKWSWENSKAKTRDDEKVY